MCTFQSHALLYKQKRGKKKWLSQEKKHQYEATLGVIPSWSRLSSILERWGSIAWSLFARR
uniref:Uncharacterized protein n=1 Tax=Rhizophora mucronata TaxID=61149 RepID=A0A2P2JG04_RHIMU